jgi:hypothetical protein
MEQLRGIIRGGSKLATSTKRMRTEIASTNSTPPGEGGTSSESPLIAPTADPVPLGSDRVKSEIDSRDKPDHCTGSAQADEHTEAELVHRKLPHAPGFCQSDTLSVHTTGEEFISNLSNGIVDTDLRNVLVWATEVLQAWNSQSVSGSGGGNVIQRTTRSSQLVLTDSGQREMVSRLGWLRENWSSIVPSVKTHISRAASAALGGNYASAKTEYLKSSIGNQAWVVGVGNCFIQERSGNDKIREVVHPMNDPQLRDFMHTFKRLLSVAEELSKTGHYIGESILV